MYVNVILSQHVNIRFFPRILNIFIIILIHLKNQYVLKRRGGKQKDNKR
jgi:hypothetical protein